ncbi:MAG: transposase [Caulobacter sp.]|nr:transposase [Caulobacter sp.]
MSDTENRGMIVVMARLARVVVPGLPHHVTQRGNRRAPIFLVAGDERIYLRILREQIDHHGVEIWAYCLMPNHVHMIATPQDEGGLSKAFGEAHRRYTAHINKRQAWTGHLFQARFASVVMDETHLLTAARYIALNPVRARLVARAGDWPWSSVGAHLAGRDDHLVSVAPLLSRIDRFADTLECDLPDETFSALRAAETTGRPLGSDAFIAGLEARLNRQLRPRRPGRKPQIRGQLTHFSSRAPG